MIRKFIAKLILYCLLPGLVLLGGLKFGWETGELFPLSFIAHVQSENREIAYLGIGSREQHFQFKLESTLIQQPELMVVGSSRAFLFQDHVAHKCPRLFYNTSVFDSTIYEVHTLVKAAIDSGHTPRVILLTLDYPDFNGDSDYRSELRTAVTRSNPLAELSSNLGRSIRLFIRHPNWLFKLQNFPNVPSQIGADFVDDPLQRHYKGDGSRYRYDLTEDNVKTYIGNHERSAQNRENMFEAGQNPDVDALKMLDDLLQLATDNDIQVIGFFPPYSQGIKLEFDRSEDFAYMPAVYEEARVLFDDHDFPLYDFSDVTSIGGDDSGMYDGWHTGIVLSTKMYITLLRNEPDLLSRYSDIEFLEALVADAEDPIYLPVDRTELEENSICDLLAT